MPGSQSTAYAIQLGSSADARQACLEKFAALGVHAAANMDGHVTGQLRLVVSELPRIGGMGLGATIRFLCADDLHIQFAPPSPAARLGPIEFMDLDDQDALVARVKDRWCQLVRATDIALSRARRLAPSTRLRLDPFRIEGTVLYRGQQIQLLFASRGHRACISAIGARTVDFLPSEPRIIIDSSGPVPVERDDLWDRAVAQAETCLGPEPAIVAPPETSHHSIDIMSRDLDVNELDAFSLDLNSGDLP